MAFPVKLFQIPVSKAKDRAIFVATRLSNTLKKLYENLKALLHYLSWYILVLMYLLFTGLAILLGRKIPTQWMKLLPLMGGKKIADKLNEKVVAKDTDVPIKPKPKFRVMDIETKKPINLA